MFLPHAAPLGTIKSLDYMRAEVLRVAGVPSDEPSFRALDLNLEISPTREMVCSPDDLRACFADEVAFRGPAYVGLDIGEAGSGTAAVAFWPVTGALRTWLSFGSVPDLTARGKRDGADYLAMQRRHELRTYPGRTVPIAAFVADLKADLGGADVRAACADSYKSENLRDAIRWPLTVMRSGTGPDGSQAVRAFQTAVLTGGLSLTSNLSLASAIKESTLRRDGNGNPAIDRARSHGRIDVLSAAILAVGLWCACEGSQWSRTALLGGSANPGDGSYTDPVARPLEAAIVGAELGRKLDTPVLTFGAFGESYTRRIWSARVGRAGAARKQLSMPLDQARSEIGRLDDRCRAARVGTTVQAGESDTLSTEQADGKPSAALVSEGDDASL